MPLSQRVSGSHERKTSSGSSSKNGPSRKNHVRFSDVDDELGSSLETEEDLRNALQWANTELNKTNEARDKLQERYDQSNKKLSESNKIRDDLRAENQSVKEHNAALKLELQRLKDMYENKKYEGAAMSKVHEDLKVRYDNLCHVYNAMVQPSPTSSKASRSSTKEKHRDDRGRIKEKEKEHKAEKERLSQRFEGKRPPPPSHRDSFIEPWGPGGRPGSVNPSTRAYTNVATGRLQPPTLTPSQQPAYSNIPRVSNPLSPGIYNPTAAVFDDEGDADDYEDGNYHPYPLGH